MYRAFSHTNILVLLLSNIKERWIMMLKYNNDLQDGIQKLVDQKQDQMFMDISLLKGKKGELYHFSDVNNETALLLLDGSITFTYDEKEITCSRFDLFHDDASALHFCRNTSITVVVEKDCEILIQQKENHRTFETVFYDGRTIDRQVFGTGALKYTTQRVVTTILDYERTPYSNMVLGEIINHPGIWSSYPPHHHPQPEVYFYKFNKPQGFGTCYIQDNCFKIKHNAVAMIPGGLTHPQNAAPGYAMYYVWMIPHLQDNIWKKTRTMDEAHTWLLDEQIEIIKI